MEKSVKAVILTGKPGIGKTTLFKTVCEDLQKSSKSISTVGFFTEEVRRLSGSRIGFDVVALDGKRGVLARDTISDGVHRRKVGKYFVFTTDFEDIVIPQFSYKPDLFAIDEIGKMELLSSKFEQQIKLLLDNGVPIFATVPLQTKSIIPVVQRLTSAETTKVYTVNIHNRGLLKDDILNDINKMLRAN